MSKQTNKQTNKLKIETQFLPHFTLGNNYYVEHAHTCQQVAIAFPVPKNVQLATTNKISGSLEPEIQQPMAAILKKKTKKHITQ